MLAEFIDQRVAHHVDKIRRVAGLNIRRGERERRGFRLFRLFPRNGMGVDHRIQNQVPAVRRSLFMAIGRQPARPLDYARQ